MADIKSGAHTGANGAVVLTDASADFKDTVGVAANTGMIMYNITDGSSGAVTAVTATTVTANLSGGTDNDWDTGDVWRIVPINGVEILRIEHYLDIAASDLHAAMAAANACNCSLATWASVFLKKLNIIDAETYYNCQCYGPKLSDDMRKAYIEWMGQQLSSIVDGTLELCSGQTGSKFPFVGWADQAWTDWNAAQIVANKRV